MDWLDYLSETEILGVNLVGLLGKLVLVAVVAGVAFAVQRVLMSVTRRALNKARVPSASIIINILRGFVWLIALMIVLEPVFGIQPTGFIATLGIGSVALSLGLQDTVSNIVGGLILMVGKVIEPGDIIKLGDFTGVVTDIDLRATCVVDAYGQVDMIPNSVLSKQALVKLSRFTEGRVMLQLPIRHSTSFDEVKADVERIARETLGEWLDEKQGVQLVVVSFDPASIITQVVVHVAHGVSLDEARNRLAEGLSGRPWTFTV